MPITPLSPDMRNKAAFVNSLFAPDVRDPAQNHLLAGIAAGALLYPYTDPGSRGLILNAWLAAWQAFNGDPFDRLAFEQCPTQDFALIGFLSPYVRRNQLDLCVPDLTFDHINDDGLAVYRDAAYQRQPFRVGNTWQYGAFDSNGVIVGDPATATVARLLELIFHGAHIVAISSDKNGGQGVQDLRDALNGSGLPTATDPYSSHYGGSALLSGLYYAPAGGPTPQIGQDNETLQTSVPPGEEPLAFALLVGVTASTHRNCFMQLEGWPAQIVVVPAGGARHNADYQANESTLWNFATYGASVYSEKRSTPIFLANTAFDLTLHADTGMPYYWGANPDNVGDGWMHPHLVIIPR